MKQKVTDDSKIGKKTEFLKVWDFFFLMGRSGFIKILMNN